MENRPVPLLAAACCNAAAREVLHLDEIPYRPWTEPGLDPVLVTAAQQGDITALLRLVHEHRLSLWRACFAITRHMGEAELLFQETLAHAVRHLRAAPVGRSVLPWLVKLARQIDAAKWRGREDRAAVGVRRPNGDPWFAGSRGAHWVEDEKRTLRAFCQLHMDDQWLLVLRLFERLPYSEIALVTGIPLARVMNRLALTREYLERVHALGERADELGGRAA